MELRGVKENIGKSHNGDKQDVMKAAGSWKVCAGQEAVAKAAIHGVHHIFTDSNKDPFLLIDAENAFNAINKHSLHPPFC